MSYFDIDWSRMPHCPDLSERVEIMGWKWYSANGFHEHKCRDYDRPFSD